jgi:hypothetical protein
MDFCRNQECELVAAIEQPPFATESEPDEASGFSGDTMTVEVKYSSTVLPWCLLMALPLLVSCIHEPL